jgi:hypothetical protein
VKNWQERARDAREHIRGVGYGKRENALSAVANGYDINTIRREIKTLDFLDAITTDFQKLGHSLDEESFASLETLARWYESDQKAAIKAARKLVAGKLNFTSLQSAMLAAKSVGAPSVQKTRASTIARSTVVAVGALLGGHLTPSKTSKRKSGQPAGLLFDLDRGGIATETVAVVVVGPYANTKLYHKRCHAWCWRGLGMAWIYNHVVLLLPSPSHLDEYRSWLADTLLDTETAMRTAKPKKRIVRLPNVHVLTGGAGR